MGSPTPLIIRVAAPNYLQVEVDASDGYRYFADLSSFQKVYCFPKTAQEWAQVSPDSFGTALIWASRFEAHMDQIIALATRREALSKTA